MFSVVMRYVSHQMIDTGESVIFLGVLPTIVLEIQRYWGEATVIIAAFHKCNSVVLIFQSLGLNTLGSLTHTATLFLITCKST